MAQTDPGELHPAATQTALERALAQAHAQIADLERRLAGTFQGLERFLDRLRAEQAQRTALERANAELQARIETLEKQVAALEKRVHRSAAPFRLPRERRQPDPRPPGRPAGHPGVWRRAPETPPETEHVPLPGCPHCQGPVTDPRPVEQVIYELPAPVAPLVRRVVTYTGTCGQCGPVRSLHPFQTSTAEGAAGVHLGPRALAVAADLRHSHGLTLRRTCRMLEEYLGLSLSSGGLSQALARMAQRVRPDYEQRIQELRDSPYVCVDETGWWLAHLGAWLWVFTTPRVTVYYISRKRGRAALEEILGARYGGVLVSDNLRVYDGYAAHDKNKCLAHGQRVIREARVRLPESDFLGKIQHLLQAALKLQRSHARLEPAVYERGVASLEARLTKLLAPHYELAAEEKVAQRFRNQRPYIFTFLRQPEVPATNNLAERQLRPAVITRKLSCGNATERGARAWEVLASLAATCRQRKESFVALMTKRLRLGGAASGLAPPSCA